ncbi:(d)CMP kinase [Defluviitalea phaphyphila]|uniref:(d)CMP kinase n=1 Tax=Defluviitalea phaphyphila TaxID=1473580 RepID=UPI000730DC94|nr:(d)CMP kinase [Defluviitalea phaphyphila]
MKHFSIAIDGPAGAGKSTIAKLLANKLKIIYVDTGAMYRAVALYCINNEINYNDKESIKNILDDIDIKIVYKENNQRVLLNGKDVSNEIRTNEVSRGASAVATIKEVRIKMVELQRNIAKGTSIVMDGRDIGTYVLPNADIKIFLTASVEERANRRYKELFQKGVNCSLEEIKNEIKQRDKNDSSREFAPLKKAKDAIEIDTTGMTVEEVIEKIVKLIPKDFYN